MITLIKMKVREKSISFAIGKKRKEVDKEHILEEKMATLEKELALPTVTTPYKHLLIEILELCKKELEDFVTRRTQGAILRCKARWYNEGEKNSKYFLNLEKRHYKLNTISQLQINENEFVTSDTGILKQSVKPSIKPLHLSRKQNITR